MAITQLKDGRWICYYRIKGDDGKSRIKKEYFGRGPQAKTAAVVRNEELKLKKRRPKKHENGHTVADLANTYGVNKTFNANSKKHLKIRLKANILPFFGHRYAIELNDQILDDYVKKRRQDGVKNSTIARELTDLLAILNWSVRRRPALIRYNPVAHYRKPKEDLAVIAPPTADETALILKHAAPHIIRAIKLSYYLGLRPGAVELLNINWQDVNWNAATIFIRSADKGGPPVRHVAIHEDFRQELYQWYQHDNKNGYIVNYNGKPIKSIGKAWRSTLKRAGITRRIRPYDLRHNFITQALEAGADIKALAQIVGSRPETIMHYYQHVSRKLHRKTVAKIPPLGIHMSKNKGSENDD